MKNKEEMEVQVNGKTEQRKVDYTVKRGRNFVSYPKLKPYEHIYENDNGVYVFTSKVK